MHECVRLPVSWIEPYEEINGKITIDCLSIPVVFTFFFLFLSFCPSIFYFCSLTSKPPDAHLEPRTTDEPPKKVPEIVAFGMNASRQRRLTLFYVNRRLGAKKNCWFYYSKWITINGHVNRQKPRIEYFHIASKSSEGAACELFFLSVIRGNAHNRMLLQAIPILTISVPSQSHYFLPSTPRHSERAFLITSIVFNDAFHSIASYRAFFMPFQ